MLKFKLNHIRKQFSTKLATNCVWAGEITSNNKPMSTKDEQSFYNSAQVPVAFNVSYSQPKLQDLIDVSLNKKDGHVQSRNTNPTVQVAEEKIRSLEQGERCIMFSTGMAAISNTLHALTKPGDKIVSIKDTYGGTSLVLMNFLKNYNIHSTLIETEDHDALEKEILKGCNIVYLESPCNPTLKITDIKRASIAAKKVNAKLLVDNTFATPINQNPLLLGADLVLHSATKFINGHGDCMGGFAVGDKKLVDTIYKYREITGATIDAMSAQLIIRGIKTLKLRVDHHNKSGMLISNQLSNHSKIKKVFYPGLPSHNHHDVAKSHMRNFGGMLSFEIKGSMEDVHTVINNMDYVHIAASLAHAESLVGVPSVTSHVECTKEEREELGISETLIRYSTGLEDPEDIIKMLDNALSKI